MALEQLQDWQVHQVVPPDAFVQAVRQAVPEMEGHYLAQLLWQRGLRDPAQLPGWLNPDHYQPASPFEFGQEMHQAVARLQQARDRQEQVAIWGDFDADGITATAVLWDGLGQFFSQQTHLRYYIPNRMTESHGLSQVGLEQLAVQGVSLIVTCDTGSTSQAEIELAAQLGMEVIVTDHHTLPATRPPVVAIINPRSLPSDHALAHLSGVAVAYKLVEALHLTWPDLPQQPLEELLDLVAIGLIADLVQLKGDCRYLAQRGIAQLQRQTQGPPERVRRPGLAQLLEFCRRTGDRPTDISFGLGPRINAVSRIQGDASFCVELLTSRDRQRCRTLAEATEVANARRKALQKEVSRQVTEKLQALDLSTTQVIVLVDTQWPVGILGLVAGQVAQTYGRPTLLLRAETLDVAPGDETVLASGSARSVQQIDLYELVADQAHLLRRFGGHPLAAGLSLPVVNLPLLTAALNQQLRQRQNLERSPVPPLQADLVVTVAELGQKLFRELKLLEPCSLGNPVPKLWIRHCWFDQLRHRNLYDPRGQKQRYIKTEFELWDDTAEQGFPGIWWEHYKDEIPPGRCDALVELDFNTYKKEYHVRLLAVRPSETAAPPTTVAAVDWLLDWRQAQPPRMEPSDVLVLDRCPESWEELQLQLDQAGQQRRSLAIAYAPPSVSEPLQHWRQLVGMAKYLVRTGQIATRQHLRANLDISDGCLTLGLQALQMVGCQLEISALGIRALPPWRSLDSTPLAEAAIQRFLAAVQEEQFRRHYFYQMPFPLIQAIAQQQQLRSNSETAPDSQPSGSARYLD